MANKTLGTRQKMMFRGAPTRPAKRGRLVFETGTRDATVSRGDQKRRLLQRLLTKSTRSRRSQ